MNEPERWSRLKYRGRNEPKGSTDALERAKFELGPLTSEHQPHLLHLCPCEKCVEENIIAAVSEFNARALVIKTKPMYMFMNMLFQQRVTQRPTEPSPTQGDFVPREDADALRDRSVIRIVTHVEDEDWLAPRCEELHQLLVKHAIPHHFVYLSNVKSHNRGQCLESMGDAGLMFFSSSFNQLWTTSFPKRQ